MLVKVRALGGDELNKDWIYRWKTRRGFIVRKGAVELPPFDIDDDDEDECSDLSNVMYAAPSAEHDHDDGIMVASSSVNVKPPTIKRPTAVKPPTTKKTAMMYGAAETISTGEAIEMLTKLRKYAELNEMDDKCAPHYEALIAAHYDHMLNITTSI